MAICVANLVEPTVQMLVRKLQAGGAFLKSEHTDTHSGGRLIGLPVIFKTLVVNIYINNKHPKKINLPENRESDHIYKNKQAIQQILSLY